MFCEQTIVFCHPRLAASNKHLKCSSWWELSCCCPLQRGETQQNRKTHRKTGETPATTSLGPIAMAWTNMGRQATLHQNVGTPSHPFRPLEHWPHDFRCVGFRCFLLMNNCFHLSSGCSIQSCVGWPRSLHLVVGWQEQLFIAF